MSRDTEHSGVDLKGDLIDSFTRCVHYHSEVDIIAIKFKCCRTYYPCYKCHEAAVNHKPDRWNASDLKTEEVVLCGMCKKQLTFEEYTGSSSTCFYCGSQFNPNCSLHYSIYFCLE